MLFEILAITTGLLTLYWIREDNAIMSAVCSAACFVNILNALGMIR